MPFLKLDQSYQSSWVLYFIDEDDDIFKPPKLTDEDFTPFGSRGGLFSGGTGLFDDEEVRMLKIIEIECFPLLKTNQKIPENSHLWKTERADSILLLGNIQVLWNSIAFQWGNRTTQVTYLRSPWHNVLSSAAVLMRDASVVQAVY